MKTENWVTHQNVENAQRCSFPGQLFPKKGTSTMFKVFYSLKYELQQTLNAGFIWSSLISLLRKESNGTEPPLFHKKEMIKWNAKVMDA